MLLERLKFFSQFIEAIFDLEAKDGPRMMYSGSLPDFLKLCDIHTNSEKYLTRPKTVFPGTAKIQPHWEKRLEHREHDDSSIDR